MGYDEFFYVSFEVVYIWLFVFFYFRWFGIKVDIFRGLNGVDVILVVCYIFGDFYFIIKFVKF